MIDRRPLLLPLLLAAVGCGPNGDLVDQTQDDGAALPKRTGTLVVDSCPMDSFQRSRLAEAATRAVIDEVVFLCLYAREDGQVGPVHPEPSARLRADIEETRARGYKVFLGLTAGESNLDWYSASRSSDLLLEAAWREQIIEHATTWASTVDGLELALPVPLENRAKPGVQALTEGLASALSPGQLGLFVPPSLTSPSDLDGGDAYDLSSLAPHVARIRVMTLDFSCCSLPGGPSVDSGWAVDALRFARERAPGKAISASLSLFGTDFSDLGPRSVTFLEATALARFHGATVERNPTGTPHFSYTDGAGQKHALWFDDTFSHKLTLGAWATALPPDAGVLYYGLGAEDPGLWTALARSQQ